MHNDETLTRVIKVVQHVFDTVRGTISGDSAAVDVDGWDSVSHTMLLLELEDEFGIEIGFEDTLSAEKLSDLAIYIDSIRIH